MEKEGWAWAWAACTQQMCRGCATRTGNLLCVRACVRACVDALILPTDKTGVLQCRASLLLLRLCLELVVLFLLLLHFLVALLLLLLQPLRRGRRVVVVVVVIVVVDVVVVVVVVVLAPLLMVWLPVIAASLPTGTARAAGLLDVERSRRCPPR